MNSFKTIRSVSRVQMMKACGKKGYRKLIVENYVGAYLLNEQTKEVVVMRFFYGARDYKRLL